MKTEAKGAWSLDSPLFISFSEHLAQHYRNQASLVITVFLLVSPQTVAAPVDDIDFGGDLISLPQESCFQVPQLHFKSFNPESENIHSAEFKII